MSVPAHSTTFSDKPDSDDEVNNQMEYVVIFEEDNDSCSAYVPDLPGLHRSRGYNRRSADINRRGDCVFILKDYAKTGMLFHCHRQVRPFQLVRACWQNLESKSCTGLHHYTVHLCLPGKPSLDLRDLDEIKCLSLPENFLIFVELTLRVGLFSGLLLCRRTYRDSISESTSSV